MSSRNGCTVQVMEWCLKHTAKEWAGGMGRSVCLVCVGLVHLSNLEFEVLAPSVLPIVWICSSIGTLVVGNGCHVGLGEVPVDHVEGGL